MDLDPLTELRGCSGETALFGEAPGGIVLSLPPDAVDGVASRAEAAGVDCLRLGTAGGDRIEISAAERDALSRVLDDMDRETQQGIRLLTTTAVERKDPAALDAIDTFLSTQRTAATRPRDGVTGVQRNRAGDAAPPGFVYGIFASIFVFFNVFAVNMLLQYRKVGRWRDYLYGERVYMLLSLFAKSALAWQVFAGTLQPA